jgi:hypothetical protein
MKALQVVIGTIIFAGLLAMGGCGSGASTSGRDSGGCAETGDGGNVDGGGSLDSVDSGAGEDVVAVDATYVNTPSTVVSDGYVTTGPWAGYGFTATDPGAAKIVPECGASTCNPPFVGQSFCMHGTVTGRTDYTGFAMLGWNVNQDTAGGAQLTWAVPQTGGLIVTVDNPSNIPLRVQLQGTNPHSSTDRWCAPLVSGQFIPWGSMLTNCWFGGKPQNPLTAGTPIQQAAIIVPGLLTDLPFDFCLVDVQIQSGPANVDGGSDAGDDAGVPDVGSDGVGPDDSGSDGGWD